MLCNFASLTLAFQGFFATCARVTAQQHCAEHVLPWRAHTQGETCSLTKADRLLCCLNMLTYLRSSSRFILCRYRVQPSSPTPPPCSHTLSSGTIPRSSLPSRYTSPVWPCATTSPPHSALSASVTTVLMYTAGTANNFYGAVANILGLTGKIQACQAFLMVRQSRGERGREDEQGEGGGEYLGQDTVDIVCSSRSQLQ